MKKRFISIVLFLCAAALVAGCSKKTIDTTKPNVAISFTYSKGLKYAPTYAVWVEDEAGNRATLFVTNKIAKSNWGTERAMVLPIWSGIREAKVDTISGATTSNQANILCNIPDAFAGKKLTLYVEANASYDYNDYYKQGLKSTDAGYNDVNGQPSMLWKAVLDPKAVRGEVTPVLVGSGEVMGKDHAVHEDISRATTAKELLSGIAVKFDFIR